MLSVVDLGIVHRVEVALVGRRDPRRDPADLRRLSGARAHQDRDRHPARRLRAPRRGRRHLRGALDERPDQPGRSRRPPRRRHRAPDRRVQPPHRPRAARPVPTLRFAPNAPRERLRPDPVPDHPLLRSTAASRSKPSSRCDVTAPSAPIGVVGAGTMGAGIAQLALEAGHRRLDPRRERRRHRARPGAHPERPRAARPTPRPRSGFGGRLGRGASGQAPRGAEARRRRCRRSGPRRRSRPRGPRRQAGDLPGARSDDLADDDPRDQHERACRSRRSRPRRSTRSASSGSISSTPRRSCRSSRSSRPARPRPRSSSGRPRS